MKPLWKRNIAALLVTIGVLLVLLLVPSLDNNIRGGAAGTVAAGDQIRLDIIVEGTQDLVGVQISLRYNANVLSYDRTEDGGFLSESGTAEVYVPFPKHHAGILDNIIVLRIVPGSVNGTGRVASAYFTATTAGDPAFQVTDVLLANSTAQPATGKVALVQQVVGTAPPTGTGQQGGSSGGSSGGGGGGGRIAPSSSSSPTQGGTSSGGAVVPTEGQTETGSVGTDTQPTFPQGDSQEQQAPSVEEPLAGESARPALSAAALWFFVVLGVVLGIVAAVVAVQHRSTEQQLQHRLASGGETLDELNSYAISPEMLAKARAYVTSMRRFGLSDGRIYELLVRGGWPEHVARMVLRQQGETATSSTQPGA